MMFDYHAAVRGAFFDIAEVAESADDIARQARYLEDGVLFLRDGRIQALLPWQEGERFLHPQKGYRDLRGKLLLPGFVDAHVHYPQTEMIGAFGEQLLEWLTTYTFPVESQFADADYAAEIAQFFVNQLLSHGTTTALIFCTLHPESVDALFNEALRLNMRLIAGKVMMDRHAPEYLSESAEQSYRQTRELIQRWHQRGRLGYAITPRFAPTSTPELLAAVQQLREEFPDTWLHTHLSENLNEVAWVKSLWPEHEHYLDVYHHYRLTGERSVFAHGIHLADAEWQCLHETGSALAFCPTSNLFLGSGLFRYRPAGRTRCGWVSVAMLARAPPSVCCAPSARRIRSASCKAIVCAPAKRFTMRPSAARTPCALMRRLVISSPVKRPILWLSTRRSRRCKGYAAGAARISMSSCSS